MSKNIVFIDTTSTNSFHEVFNFSFLYSLSRNENKSIKYFADNSSIAAIKKLADKNDIDFSTNDLTFESIYVYKGNSSLKIFIRNVFSSFMNVYLSIRYFNSIIIFSNLNPFFVPIFFMIKYILRKKVYFVLHGELEYVLQKPRFYKPLFFYKFLVRFFLKHINSNVKLIVLGNSIKSNLLTLFDNLNYDSVISIHHPYIFDFDIYSPQSSCTPLLKIGTIGSIAWEKGLNDLLLLTNKLEMEIIQSKVSISIIGRNSLKPDQFPLLHFIPSNPRNFLSYDLYNSHVKSLDCILFFYNLNTYKLTASGAIFDAINHCKPIIALRNDYFSEIFKICGEIGFLCESVDEMYLKILHLHKSPEIVDNFKTNLLKAKNVYNFKNHIFELN